jgi:predicted ATP-grasp superfamily ATP-dependent carboligase
MTAKQPPAIVLGGGSGNGLGIARNLGRLGIPVYCLTSDVLETTCFSRYCRGYWIIPQIEDSAQVLHHTLQQLMQRLPGPAVLFPTSDTVVLTLATLLGTLEPYIAMMPPRPVAETLVLKHAFYESLRTHDVPHPRTLDPSEQSLQELQQHLPFPVYVRPIQSLRFHERFQCKGFVAANSQELEHYLHLTEAADLHVLVQEIIPGAATQGVLFQGYFDRASRPIVMVASRKLRQASMFANSSAEVSIPHVQVHSCAEILTTYFQAIGYRGLFGAEFKRDPRDGVYKLLEVNARSMGGNAHSTQCGANDIYAAYRDALGELITPRLDYQAGVYSMFLLSDLKTISTLLRQRAFSLRDVLEPYRHKKQMGIFAWDDPLPFIVNTWALTRARVLPGLNLLQRPPTALA